VISDWRLVAETHASPEIGAGLVRRDQWRALATPKRCAGRGAAC